jgi:hypothetical protein
MADQAEFARAAYEAAVGGHERAVQGDGEGDE